MTNATKTLAIIFAGTLAIAFATSWSWSSSSSTAFQEQLLAVDTSAVQAVRIEGSDASSVRLERADGNWSVAPSDTAVTYPASATAVQDLLQTLPSLQVSTVTTRQTSKHPRYGVDSTGTRVALLGAGDETLGELIVGRTRIQRPQGGAAQNRRQRLRRQRRGTPITYVRRPDQSDVYSIEQSLRTVTSRSLDDWRDKQLWTVDRSEIRQVDVTIPGDSSFTMKRAAPSDTASAAAPDTWLSAGDTLETSAVSSMLRTLSTPTADGFVNDASPDTFGKARYKVQLQTADGTRRTLRLKPDGENYVEVADGFPYVVTLRKSSWDNSVLQGRTALLKNK